jgi:NIPSNAP
MIFDHRTYTVRPGTLPKHLKLYEEHGFPAQRRHLGEPLLYAVTETGPLNTYVHVWVYEDAADRARKRAAMEADPDWIEYRRLSAEAGYLVGQENKILTPASFFELSRRSGTTAGGL